MGKKTRATMADVARAANVTPQTVSRAFRNAPDISEETRERILEIAADLHYVMNNTASSLRGGSSRQIVIVYDNLINVYFSIMIDYIQSSLREKGYSILILSVADARFNRSAYEFAVSHYAAGIISFLEPDEEIGELVEGFGLPVLILGRRTEVKNIDYLRADDVEGGRLAAKRLIEKGARRLAYLTIDFTVSCACDRFRGFEEEALHYGLDAPIVVDAYSKPLESILNSLFTENAPDGIFCFNDMLAFDVLYCIQKNGLPPVPVVGYDGVQQELHFPIDLISIGPDKRMLASRAAEMIISRIEMRKGKRRAETAEVFLFEGK